MKTPQLAVVLAVLPGLFLATACGGGGGGGSTALPTQITAANAEEVAGVMPMTLELISFEEVLGFDTLTATGEGTVVCPSGGTATAGFQIDVPPVGVVSTGDRFTVDFNNCLLDGTSSLNGGMVLDFDNITGDYLADDVWEVDLSLSINDLTFASGPASGSFDGSLSQSTSYDMGDASFSLAGDFTVGLNDGTGLQTASLSGLTLTCNYDATAGESTYTNDGTYASSELGGSITLATLTPIAILDGSLYPYTGVVEATGAMGSVLLVTVLDETFVQLEVDEDGDGNFEVLVVTTWTALEN